MWIIYCSAIIAFSVLINCVINKKIILPKFKYFITLCFLTMLLIGGEFAFNFFNYKFSFFYNEIIMFLFLGLISLYLEKISSVLHKKKMKKKILIPFCLLFVFFLTFYVLIKQTTILKEIPMYKQISKYYSFVFSLILSFYLLLESFFKKNKGKVNLIIGSTIMLVFIICNYIYNAQILALGASIILLFIYEGIENNINYYDLNNKNFNLEVFLEKYQSHKISKKKHLIFIKIDDNNIDKNISLDKILKINPYKFKKNLFAFPIKISKFEETFIKQQELIKFRIKEKLVEFSYHIYITDTKFLNYMTFDIRDVIEYLSSKNETFSKCNVYKLSMSKDAQKINENIELNKLIKNAVENNGFEMYYQPIYSTKEKKYISAEALIRLRDCGSLNFISPEVFIPIAEKNGYAEKIGNIVFEKVCSFFKQKELVNKGIEYIELNVSGLHIVSNTIVSDFSKILNKYKINSKNINIEVTETAEITNKSQINKNLSSLRKLGFKFSMDDFGSGYSDMMNIITNNYELIKIDKSIVWGALKEETKVKETEILLKTCINLGHQLNRNIVAEGVETKEMCDYLISKKVEYLQGYYFSKPLNEKDFIDFLAENNWGISESV